MISVLVTGAGGFLGRSLVRGLLTRGYRVRLTEKTPELAVSTLAGLRETQGSETPEVAVTGDIGKEVDWRPLLEGIDAIIHLAARAHVLNETDPDPTEAYRRVNFLGTKLLAEAAVEEGIRRFLFLSTIGVNGQNSGPGKSFHEELLPNPQNPYSESKLHAERALLRFWDEKRLEPVIIRPPLVYGPGVPGNFLRLMQWVDSGVPLPLAGIRNRRSLVGVENLTDFLINCLEHPKAPGGVFMVNDDETLSTTELVSEIARSLGKPIRMFRIPEPVARISASLLGQSRAIQQLYGSLEIRGEKARTQLNWRPPKSFREGLEATTEWYRLKRTLPPGSERTI